jgi:hypothetical protein
MSQPLGDHGLLVATQNYRGHRTVWLLQGNEFKEIVNQRRAARRYISDLLVQDQELFIAEKGMIYPSQEAYLKSRPWLELPSRNLHLATYDGRIIAATDQHVYDLERPTSPFVVVQDSFTINDLISHQDTLFLGGYTTTYHAEKDSEDEGQILRSQRRQGGVDIVGYRDGHVVGLCEHEGRLIDLVQKPQSHHINYEDLMPLVDASNEVRDTARAHLPERYDWTSWDAYLYHTLVDKYGRHPEKCLLNISRVVSFEGELYGVIDMVIDETSAMAVMNLTQQRVVTRFFERITVLRAF